MISTTAVEHDVRLEKVLPLNSKRALPVCTGGQRPEPPEDCGGARAYMEEGDPRWRAWWEAPAVALHLDRRLRSQGVYDLSTVRQFTWRMEAGSSMPSRWLRMNRPGPPNFTTARKTRSQSARSSGFNFELYAGTDDELILDEIEKISV